MSAIWQKSYSLIYEEYSERTNYNFKRYSKNKEIDSVCNEIFGEKLFSWVLSQNVNKVYTPDWVNE